MSECWCDEPHEWENPTVDQAFRNIGHEVIAALRIPELVKWLDGKMKP